MFRIFTNVVGLHDKHGTGQACKIGGNLDSSLYCEILSDNLLSTAEYYHMDHRFFVFQQDNDNVTEMDWPPQSLDMNLIEYL